MRIYERNFFIYQNSKHEETTLFKGKVAVITVKRNQFKWGWKVRYRPCPSGGELPALISHR